MRGDSSAATPHRFCCNAKSPAGRSRTGSPLFTFTTASACLNDPNGLVYHNGEYHLCHQFNYNITACSWAHYASRDLVHWEERPVGLWHDELGSMHSGSAAVDVLNTSGWQTGGHTSGNRGLHRLARHGRPR